MTLRRRMERDLDRDVQEHIEMETQENIARGMPPGDARLAALRKFGNVTQVMEQTRAVWRWTWLERLAQDLRYSVRTLRRNPGFTAVAVLTLALGIGMNTAVFSVVNAVLLRPLSYPDPERLLWLANYNEAFQMEAVAGPDFIDWRQQAQSFQQMACYEYNDMTIASAAGADQSMVAAVSDDFWPLTGSQPALGRLFFNGERDAIVLTDKLFRRQFNSDPSVVGKNVTLNGRSVTIAGVLPAAFRFQFPMPQRAGVEPKEVEAYIPSDVSPQTQSRRNRGMAILNVVGKLKPGVDIEHARAELLAIQDRIARDNPGGFYHLVKLRVLPAQQQLIGGARQALVILSAAVGFVLLIACANLANLLLARLAARHKEIAIRAAVGAGRGRVMRQLLAESMLLSLTGGAFGLLLARWGIAMLVRFGHTGVPRLSETRIDAAILAFTLSLSLLTGLLFGLAPAVSLSRSRLHDLLKEGRSSSGVSGRRVRTVLVAGQLAAALVLLTGAGLMIRSFWRMNQKPPGFDPEHTVVMKLSLTGPTYRAMPQQLAYFQQVLERIETAPAVQAAGIVYSPVRGFVQVEGVPGAPGSQPPQAVFYSTSSGYFRAMGMRLVGGRLLTGREPTEVVLVNQAFVRQVFGGVDPLGKHIRVPRPQPPPLSTIVGVVSDLKYSRLDAEPGPEVYFPYTQSPFARAYDVVARVSGDPETAAAGLRKLIAAIDPTQPVYDVKTLEDALSASIAPRRFNLLLLAVFAAAALVLAGLGVYGVMSYTVAQRTREIGIRLALGARREEVVGMVVRQGMIVAASGIAGGIAAAFALTRLMSTLLYDVKPTDAATFAAVAGLLAVAAFLACCVPALRAARVDPVIALRYE